MPPTPRSFSHVSLYVEDVLRAAVFFQQECGLGVSRQPPDRSTAFLSSGSNHHEVEIFIAPVEKVSHLGIEYACEADLLAAARSLQAADVPIRRWSVVPGLIRSLFCEDPEGNGLHLFANLSRDWTAWRRGEGASEPWHPDDLGDGSTDRHGLESFPAVRHPAAPCVATFFAGGVVASHGRESLAAFYAQVLGFDAQGAGGTSVLRGTRTGSALRITDGPANGLSELCFRVGPGQGRTLDAAPCNLTVRLLAADGPNAGAR